MNRNKKGFTLIEIIAVIIIIGLLLLIVAPSMSRLINSGDDKKYEEYYSLVLSASELYAREREGDLGGIKGTGCIDITINDLIENEYLKEYNEDSTVCLDPYDEKITSGVSSGNVGIRIRNNKGKITILASLVCVNERNKIVYSKLTAKDGECKKYGS